MITEGLNVIEGFRRCVIAERVSAGSIMTPRSVFVAGSLC